MRLDFLFRWNILVICSILILDLAVTPFTRLYFRTIWQNWLNFFGYFKKNLRLWPTITEKTRHEKGLQGDLHNFIWLSTPYNCSTPQTFPRRTRVCTFAVLTKHALSSLAYSQDFLKICLRVKIWSEMLLPELKLHWFSYFATFFKALIIHFSSVRKRCATS